MSSRAATLRHLSALAAFGVATAGLLAADRPARACGGCFSPSSAPTDDLVVQDGERVLFHRDPMNDTTTVWVEVRYAGAAQDFGWVLPLERPPIVGTGPRFVFDALDQDLGVRHELVYGGDENCRNPREGCEPQQHPTSDVVFADTTAFADTSGGFAGPGSVTVIDQGQTGPYDYVVVGADDAQLLYDWLNARGYSTPSAATPILASHVAKGDVFVAVKLQNDAGVDLIRPLTLTMQGADPCVPLRLTSIAARDDMAVSITLAGPGRAVPKNHLDVVVNPVRLNWTSSPPANNYTQVAAAAIDEAGGHAFVTEYAGSGTRLRSTAQSLRDARDALTSVATAYTVGTTLASEPGLPVTDETAAIFAEHVALAELAPGASPAAALAVLRACAGAWRGGLPNDVCAVEGIVLDRDAVTASPVDGAALAAALDADFVVPAAGVLELLADAPMVTRLMLWISPSEMDRDPIFDFNPDLPQVSNVVRATARRVCTSGWYPHDRLRLSFDGLGTWLVGLGGATALDPRFKDAPLALATRLLDATGPPIPVAPQDIPLVDTAIAGSTPGTPSLPPELVLSDAAPWSPPASDPPATGRGAWPRPADCVPLPGWADGQIADGGGTGAETTDAPTSRRSGGCASGGGPTEALALALAFATWFALRRRAWWQ